MATDRYKMIPLGNMEDYTNFWHGRNDEVDAMLLALENWLRRENEMQRFFEVISEYAELPKEERPTLPKRQTRNSAGYDFYAPEDVLIQKGIGGLIRTGIKVHMPEDEHLEIHIRSSYGMKYGMRLANGVGIIDADYYNNPDNEGEIMVKLINDGAGDVMIHKGDRFAQGIFVKHYLTDNDDADGERTGGVGSSGK